MARHEVYGEDVVARGPVYQSHEGNGESMLIRFTHADGLGTRDGKPPTGFWLAGEDRSWHPAEATVSGTTVALRSGAVARPIACRYAFCGKPEVNLVNAAGLPAYPFRTDDWPNPLTPDP